MLRKNMINSLLSGLLSGTLTPKEKKRFVSINDRRQIKLERWYGVSIEVKDREILEYRISGTFQNQTFEQAMTALSTAASFSFIIDKNHVIVSK